MALNLKRHTLLSRVLIMVMGLWLCLNCAAKREIKIALDIPVSQGQQASKVYSGHVCLATVAQTKRSFEKAQHPAGRSRYCPEGDMSFSSAKVSSSNTHPFAGIKLPAAIPVYIFHEQFLI